MWWLEVQKAYNLSDWDFLRFPTRWIKKTKLSEWLSFTILSCPLSDRPMIWCDTLRRRIDYSRHWIVVAVEVIWLMAIGIDWRLAYDNDEPLMTWCKWERLPYIALMLVISVKPEALSSMHSARIQCTVSEVSIHCQSFLTFPKSLERWRKLDDII